MQAWRALLSIGLHFQTSCYIVSKMRFTILAIVVAYAATCFCQTTTTSTRTSSATSTSSTTAPTPQLMEIPLSEYEEGLTSAMKTFVNRAVEAAGLCEEDRIRIIGIHGEDTPQMTGLYEEVIASLSSLHMECVRRVRSGSLSRNTYESRARLLASKQVRAMKLKSDVQTITTRAFQVTGNMIEAAVRTLTPKARRKPELLLKEVRSMSVAWKKVVEDRRILNDLLTKLMSMRDSVRSGFYEEVAPAA